MHENDTPPNVGSNDGLGLAQDRAAFECLVMQLTGRDMDYHDRNGTTGLDTAWLCYRAGVAAERERCSKFSRMYDHEGYATHFIDGGDAWPYGAERRS